jgi:hypothetical protein
MRPCFRALVATITGALVTIVLAYLGAIVLLVARMGIPLGSEGRDPTRGEYVGLLMIAGGAAAIGGHIAAGLARQRRRTVVSVLAAFLAGGALWGFTSPASQWPAWWAPVLAAVAAFGTWLGGAILRPGRKPAFTLL